jgi:hypothetical protein
VLKIEVFNALQMGFGTSKNTSRKTNPSKHNPHAQVLPSLEVLDK